MEIRTFETKDKETLINFFLSEVDESYISHGEIQMGISSDGETFLPGFKDKWRAYFERQIDADNVFINVCYENSQMLAFIIFGVEDDYDKKYGVLYDLMVAKSQRGKGLVEDVFKSACSSLCAKGICRLFFESGSNCHRAHTYYERKGAKHISNIYEIDDISTLI